MLAGHDGHRGDASVDHALLPGGMLSGSERSEGSIIRFLIEEGTEALGGPSFYYKFGWRCVGITLDAETRIIRVGFEYSRRTSDVCMRITAV